MGMWEVLPWVVPSLPEWTLASHPESSMSLKRLLLWCQVTQTDGWRRFPWRQSSPLGALGGFRGHGQPWSSGDWFSGAWPLSQLADVGPFYICNMKGGCKPAFSSEWRQKRCFGIMDKIKSKQRKNRVQNSTLKIIFRKPSRTWTL